MFSQVFLVLSLVFPCLLVCPWLVARKGFNPMNESTTEPKIGKTNKKRKTNLKQCHKFSRSFSVIFIGFSCFWPPDARNWFFNKIFLNRVMGLPKYPQIFPKSAQNFSVQILCFDPRTSTKLIKCPLGVSSAPVSTVPLKRLSKGRLTLK